MKHFPTQLEYCYKISFLLSSHLVLGKYGNHDRNPIMETLASLHLQESGFFSFKIPYVCVYICVYVDIFLMCSGPQRPFFGVFCDNLRMYVWEGTR